MMFGVGNRLAFQKVCNISHYDHNNNQINNHIQGIADVLIDASRDGSLWWSENIDFSNLDGQHHGKDLIDYLQNLGYRVNELRHDTNSIITGSLLKKNQFVIRIRPSISCSYISEEIEEYKKYVREGGKLILLGHFMLPGQKDSFAEEFGITFAGTVRNERSVSRFIKHPLTQGLGELPYGGCGITKYPDNATIVAWLSEKTYLDIGDGECNVELQKKASGIPAMGYMRYGFGKIVFLGDTYLLSSVYQPLTNNIVRWIIEY
jgi:hypothetical protein